MSSLPIGLIIEGLVAVLLLVTIAYCWTLNRRLQRLRADEQTLRATISELMTATEIAERAILGLKTTAADADKTLGHRLKEAETTSHNLVDQIGQGEKIFARISQIAEAARAASGRREPVPQEPQMAAAQTSYAPEAQRAGYGYNGHPAHANGAPGHGVHGHSVPGQGVHGQAVYSAPVSEPERPRSSKASDIRSAAAEAAARLEQFRKRKGAAA